jgi:hypothetical protein
MNFKVSPLDWAHNIALRISGFISVSNRQEVQASHFQLSQFLAHQNELPCPQELSTRYLRLHSGRFLSVISLGLCALSLLSVPRGDAPPWGGDSSPKYVCQDRAISPPPTSPIKHDSGHKKTLAF